MAEDDSEQEKKIRQEESAKKNSSSFWHLIPVIALILAILALILALRTLQQNRSWIDENQSLSKAVEQIDNNQKTLSSTLEEIGSQNENRQQKVEAELKNLNSAFENLKQQSRYGQDHWLLLKARYYLELAEIQSHWGDNLELTIALLKQADALLSSVNAPNLFTIRQNIAKEIAHLKSIAQLDLVGILSRLDALQNSVNNLMVASHLSMPNLETKNQDKQESTWRSHLKDSLNLLKKMVVIRHQDQDVQPLFSSLEINLLRENIRNNIQEAKWGLLRNTPAVYQLALEQTAINLQRSFDMQAQNTKSFLQELNALKAIELVHQPQLNLNETIQDLNQLLNAQSTEQSS